MDAEHIQTLRKMLADSEAYRRHYADVVEATKGVRGTALLEWHTRVVEALRAVLAGSQP